MIHYNNQKNTVIKIKKGVKNEKIVFFINKFSLCGFF